MGFFSGHSPFSSRFCAVWSSMVITFMLVLLPLAMTDAGADQQHTSSVAPVASNDAFDVFMEILQGTDTETLSKKMKSSEFAICKAATKCASVHLPCPATCVESFYGGGGYERGFGGYGRGYGGYDRGYGGYGRGDGYGRGYGPGYGYGSRAGGGGGGGGGDFTASKAFACSYDCHSNCKATCN
ncbi:hypothetical protein KP509_13G059100 [Ceratopteris richardii]|uniref:Uncharacterized protein n=1 Tax=Ceratopteris richardii TaxID=49495 RepID=A0A8T2TG39_CERRI|nr:hypothetical protein KP509_13G059100 [Ceratopteris richardii]